MKTPAISLSAIRATLGLLANLAAGSARAQSWLPTSGISDWNTASNWSPATVPSATGETRLVNGTALLSGAGSTLSLWIGGTGPGGIGVGTLAIGDGGVLTSAATYLGPNSGGNGTVNVTGTGIWNSNGSNAQLYVGISGGTGKINLSSGGTMTSANGTYVGYGSNTNGFITIDGPTSLWTLTGFIYLGAIGGNGTLTLQNGGTLRTASGGTGDLYMIYSSSSGSGTLNIGNGGTPGTLQAGRVWGFSSNANKVSFNHDSSAYTFSPGLNGTLSVEQKGSGTTTLGGVLSYTGATRVLAGTLAINAATLADAAPVEIAAGAKLALGFNGTDTVANLTLGGQLQVPGTWGAIGSGAAHETSLITGTGKLLATTGAADPYQTWINTQGVTLPADQAITADPDHDGLINLVEYALNLNAAVANVLPAPTLASGLLKLGYPLNTAATDVTVTPEWSDDLATWHTDGITLNNLGTSGTTQQMEATLPLNSGAKRFLRLRVVK